MFKRGVTALDAFAERAIALERAHKAWFPFSYALLAEFENRYLPEHEPLLTRLYESMPAGTGVRKITWRGRLAALDDALLQHLDPAAVREGVIVHDLGASNGITALDLFRKLQKAGPAQVVASDHYDRLYLISPPGTAWIIVFDVDRKPLQLVRAPWVLTARRPEPWRYPVNRMLQAWMLRSILPRARQLLDRHLERTAGNGLAVREVRLIHPDCLSEERKGGGFRMIRHDLFTPNPIRCHVVRAINVLTRKHLAPKEIIRGLRAAATNLLPQGVLIVGRTVDEQDGRLNVAAFRKRGPTWEECWRLNEGYEDADLLFSEPSTPRSC